MAWSVMQGDVRDRLSELPEKSVQCVVTSPPYWGLRDYGVDGQIGLEPTPEEYVQNMVEIFRGVWRVLRDDGVVWLNLGSSYSSGGVLSNFTDCFNRVMEGGPVVIGHTATIGITAEGVDVSLDNKGFPYGELLSLFGIERVIVKQRDNDFCQVLYTLTGPCYCWIGAPALSVSRNMADLEIIFYSGYDISIIITEHNSNSEPKLRIPAVGSAGAGVDNKRSFAIKEPCKPITEVISDGETIGDIASLDATPKRLPNIYFIDEAVSFGNGLNPRSGDISNFRITKATLEQFNFSVPDSGFNVAVHGVSHFYTSNMYGSFIHYNQLYHKAEQLSNEMQSKQELGEPEMVKRALMRDGWICRSTIIWAKPNPMPESVTDRPTKAHEYIFLLSKSGVAQYWTHLYNEHSGVRTRPEPDYEWTHKKTGEKRRVEPSGDWRKEWKRRNLWIGHDYFYDAEAVKENRQGNTHGRGTKKTPPIESAGIGHRDWCKYMTKDEELTSRNRRTVWTISTQPYPEAHFACVDEETECLTVDGWKRYCDIKPGVVAAQYDMKENCIQWAEVEDVAIYDVVNEPIVVAQNRDVKLMLTPNHRTIISRRHPRTRQYQPLTIIRADELKPSHSIPVSARWNYEGIEPLSPEWAELLGWYVTEGCETAYKWTVEIYQSKSVNPAKVKRIEYLLNAVGAEYSKAECVTQWRGKDRITTAFQIKGFAAVKLRGIAPQKKLPQDVLMWSDRLLQRLLDGLVDGDGHRRKDGRMSFIQRSSQMADLVQGIGVRLGYATMKSRRSEGTYTVYFTKKRLLSFRGTAGEGAEIKQEAYTGKVWCPKLPAGTWVARKKGRMFITGNTFPPKLIEPCVLAGTSPRACEICGAPWERMVEKTGHVNNREPAYVPGNSSTKTDSTGWAPTTRATNKWLPTCKCENEGTGLCIVLDPFAGSGTTLWVAEQHGRDSIGIELSLEYCKLINKRMDKMQLNIFNMGVVK